MSNKHVISGVEVELDPGVDPADVERYGADSRDDTEIDLDAIYAAAEADAHLEQEGDDA